MSLLQRTRSDILLGIIDADGTVRLRLSDIQYRGHREWAAMDRLARVWRGFSIGVRDGEVVVLYAASVLNPKPDPVLEPEVVGQLKQVLPFAVGHRVFHC